MLFFALKWGVAEQRATPLTVSAPEGIQERLEAMEAAFGDHVGDPGFPVVVREVSPGESFEVGPTKVKAAATPHTAESLAYRIEHQGEALGFTGDTGPSADVARFLADCDLMIAECSLPDSDAKPTHLTPSSLAEMAREARPKRLVVSHVYPQLDALDPLARIRAAGWDGPMTRARDGLRLSPGMDDPSPSV